MFTRLNTLSKSISVVSSTRRSLIQPNKSYLHSTTKPTVPISPPPEKTTSTTTTSNTTSNSNATPDLKKEIDSQPPIGQHHPDSTSTPRPSESHPDVTTKDVKMDKDHNETFKHRANTLSSSTESKSDSVEIPIEKVLIEEVIIEFKINHLSEEPSLSEEIIHAERLGLKPEDILKELEEKKEKEKEKKVGQEKSTSSTGGNSSRGFHTSSRNYTEDSTSTGEKEDTEGVKVGEGQIGKNEGEGKKEVERSILSDETKLGETKIGKEGGNQFGGALGGSSQINSTSSSQKRSFSTTRLIQNLDGKGNEDGNDKIGSKGTPKGEHKGKGLEHLNESQPSESEEAVHADKFGSNPLDDLPEHKKASTTKKE